MKIEIDDRTFDKMCSMNAEDLKSFFNILKEGISSEKVDLSYKELKKKIPKNSKKLLEEESSQES